MQDVVLPQELACQPSDSQEALVQDVCALIKNMPKPHRVQPSEVACGASLEAPDEVAADLPEPLGSKLEADALASALSPLSEYLPLTPQNTPLVESGAESSETSGKVAQQLQASGKSAQQRICEGQDATASAESRALSKKKQTLAKVAQEQANTRKERFVFGRPGTTPTRKKDLKLTPVSKPELASVALPPVEQEVSGK